MSKKAAFSIVLAIHDQALAVDSNLPILLTQQYEGQYNVIVVDESSTDDTADTLERLKAEHPRLYTTFLPKYQFQTNRLRLALTIGVKAAKNDWIIFTDITKPVPGETWLDELSGFCNDTTVLLLGYINRKNGNVQLSPYHDIQEAASIIRRAERWRAGVGIDRWMSHLQKSASYDFIVVRTDRAHQLLQLFAIDPAKLTKKER